jgi:hypothetical protein
VSPPVQREKSNEGDLQAEGGDVEKSKKLKIPKTDENKKLPVNKPAEPKSSEPNKEDLKKTTKTDQ